MKRLILTLSIIATLSFASCSNDDTANQTQTLQRGGELETFEDSLNVAIEYSIKKLQGDNPDPITYERIRLDCVNEWTPGEAVVVITIGTKSYKADLHQMADGDWTWIGYNPCTSKCNCDR